MQKYILILLLLSVTIFSTEKNKPCKYKFNQEMSFEVGLNIGTPVSTDLRFWIIDSIAVTSKIGLDFEKNFNFDLGILFEFITLYENDNLALKFDFGFLGSMGPYKDKNDKSVFQTSIFMPLGFSIPLKNESTTFSLYFAPGMRVLPEITWNYQFGVMYNYNFGRASKLKKYKICLKNRIIKFGNTVDSLNNKLGNSYDKIGSLEGDKKQLDNKIGSLEGEKKQLINKITLLENDKKELNQKITNIKGEMVQLEKDMRDSDNRKQKKLRDKIDELKKEIEVKNSEIETVKKESNKKLTEATEKIKNANKEIEKRDQKLEKIKKEKQAAQIEVIKLNKKRCILSGGTFNKKCICPTGRVARASECVCAGVNQIWSDRYKKCICKKAYTKKKGVCTKCKLVSYWGTCVNRCTAPQIPWKGKCSCPYSKNFIRSKNGNCICKKGYKEYIPGKCSPEGN